MKNYVWKGLPKFQHRILWHLIIRHWFSKLIYLLEQEFSNFGNSLEQNKLALINSDISKIKIILQWLFFRTFVYQNGKMGTFGGSRSWKHPVTPNTFTESLLHLYRFIKNLSGKKHHTVEPVFYDHRVLLPPVIYDQNLFHQFNLLLWN